MSCVQAPQGPQALAGTNDSSGSEEDCPVCLFPTSNKLVRCQHLICEGCLARWHREKQKERKSTTCPECRDRVLDFLPKEEQFPELFLGTVLKETPLKPGYEDLTVAGERLGVSEESLRGVIVDYIKKCLKDQRDIDVKEKVKEYVCLVNEVTKTLQKKPYQIGSKLRYLIKGDILDLYRKIPIKLIENVFYCNTNEKKQAVPCKINKELTKCYGAKAREYVRVCTAVACFFIALYLFLQLLLLCN